MKKTSKTNKIIISVTALVLTIAITCVAVIPFLKNKQTKNYMYADASEPKVFNAGDFDVTFGEQIKFLFNTKNGSFAVASGDLSNLFFSHSQGAADNDKATLLDIRLRDKKGNSYTMSSSSNSIAFNTFEVTENEKNSLSVNFSFFPDKESADSGVEKSNVYAVIPFRMSFENSKITVSVDTSKVVLPKGFFLEKVTILPGLFSVKEGEPSAKYIVPDGSGAVIDVSSVTEKPLALNLNVYGSDVAFSDYSEGALLPYFAMVNANGFGVNTIIEEGDALSQIVCKKHENGGGYLYNTFTVTACGIVNEQFKFGESYKGNLSQSYVIDDSEADYNSVAVQVRDSLIKRDFLSSTLNGNYTDLPFFIKVIGSSDGDKALTTFEGAAEITALLKSRGVRNIALRLSGYGENGLSSVGNIKPSKELGGEDGLNVLCEEVSQQGNGLYLDVNIFASSSSSGKKVSIYDDESKFIGVKSSEFALSKTSAINKNISQAYNFISQYGIAGACVNDASGLLYTDIKGKADRQSLMYNAGNYISSLSACGNLMLDEPAVYLAKNAAAIFSTPHEASSNSFSCVTSVPVLQMVLHGSVVYGSQPINVSNMSYDDALLKCIEYGCVPSFMFTHSDDTGISYNSYATQTAKMYSRAKQLLPVMNMSITSHEKVTDGVYKITYDYSKVFYVNYNPSLVEVNGIMVSAKDFVVI